VLALARAWRFESSPGHQQSRSELALYPCRMGALVARPEAGAMNRT
jgi:hypothetical protein